MATRRWKQVSQLLGTFLALSMTAVVLFWRDSPGGRDVWRLPAPRPAADARLGDIINASQVFDTSKLNMEQGYKFLQAIYHHNKLKFNAPMMQLALLSEAEKESLINDLEPDLTALPSKKHSRLILVTRVRDTASSNMERQKPQNETVTVRLDLHDSQARPLTRGGHQVLMWISNDRNGSAAATAALQAVDMRNGSYLASFPVLWRGETRVHATLFFSREVQNAMTRGIIRQQNPYPMVGAFSRGNVDQATYCGPFPDIPGFPVTCNRTTFNHGLDWFCGAPSKAGLTCRDWRLSRGVGYRAWPTSDMSRADRQVISAYWKWAHGIVDHSVAFSSNASLPVRPRLSCSKRLSRDTWTDQSPTGFFLGTRWQNLACSVPDDAASEAQSRGYDCFRNTTFWYMGDSNARQIYKITCGLIRAKLHTGFASKHHIHLPLWCANATLNARMEWHPHELPLLSGSTWSERIVKLSPRYLMQRIPDSGRHVILVHLFAHFSYFPSSVYTQHVRDLAAGVRDLLRRNPTVKVVIRGPHCWHQPQRADFLATMTSRVLKTEFRKEERERVVYMDAWGMSVAGTRGGCELLHPPLPVLKALADLFLGYVC